MRRTENMISGFLFSRLSLEVHQQWFGSTQGEWLSKHLNEELRITLASHSGDVFVEKRGWTACAQGELVARIELRNLTLPGFCCPGESKLPLDARGASSSLRAENKLSSY